MVWPMPNAVNADLISTAELAKELGVHVRTIHRMVKRGQLSTHLRAPGEKGAWLFLREDVERLKDAA